jgi:hypothetical protein
MMLIILLNLEEKYQEQIAAFTPITLKFKKGDSADKCDD